MKQLFFWYLQDRCRDAKQKQNYREEEDDHIFMISQKLCRLFTAVSRDFGA